VHGQLQARFDQEAFQLLVVDEPVLFPVYLVEQILRLVLFEFPPDLQDGQFAFDAQL
jgi:hypothetical protein